MTSITKFTKTSKKLRTTFEAFKFPASDTVQFRALITPCLSSCKPVQCSLLNTETGINQEFVSYGRRKRRDTPDLQSGRGSSGATSSLATSSSASSSSGSATHGTMYETLGGEEQAKSSTGPIRRSSSDSSPDVVVVGAIRITENFAAFESNREAEERDATASSSGSEGGDNGAGNYSQLSSLSGSDAASNPHHPRNQGSSGSHSDDCSNMIGLIIACVIFLSGQSILLMAWIYMYRMSGVYRSKFFAFHAPSLADSSSDSSKSSILMRSPSRHQASVAGSALPVAKTFPHCYSLPFASCSFEAPAATIPDTPNATMTNTAACNIKNRSSALPSATGSASPSHAMPPHRVAEFMSKRNFNHP